MDSAAPASGRFRAPYLNFNISSLVMKEDGLIVFCRFEQEGLEIPSSLRISGKGGENQPPLGLGMLSLMTEIKNQIFIQCNRSNTYLTYSLKSLFICPP